MFAAAGWVLIAATGCRTSAPLKVPVGAAPPQPLAEAAPAPRVWRTTLVSPGSNASSFFFYEGVSRILQVYRNGPRHELTEEGATSASSFPLGFIEHVAEREGVGALFVANGAVYRAPDALGLVEYVGDVQITSLALGAQDGFACSRDGRLVRIAMSGSASIEQLERPCTSVSSGSEGFFVEHPADTWSWSSKGPDELEPSEPPGQGEWNYPMSILPSVRASSTYGAAEDLATLSGRLLGTWKAEDGRIYSVSSTWPYAMVVHDGDAWVPVATPRGLRCDVAATAEGPIAICDGKEPDSLPADRLFRHDLHWREFFARGPSPESLKIPRRSAVSIIDGAAVLLGACELDWRVEGDDTHHACVIGLDKRPLTLREWTAAVPEESCEAEGEFGCEDERSVEQPGDDAPMLIGFQHPYLIYRSAARAPHVEFVDVRSSVRAFSELPECSRGGWAGPGWITCITEQAGKSALVVARIDDAGARVVELPVGAESVGFADDLRGMAAGISADEIWTTIDGAQSWTKLDPGLDSHPGNLRVETVECTNVVCGARPVVWADPDVLQRFELPDVRFVGPAHLRPLPRVEGPSR